MIIAQITDLHVRPYGLRASDVVETNAMLEAAVENLMALDPLPDVVIATGDLTDCGLMEEYKILKAILGRLPMPVYLVPGNHDRRENLRATFSDADYLPKDGEFLHYTVEHHPIRLIGLDTVIPGAGHGEICARRLAWIDERLAEQPERPTIVFMHHPPFATGIAHMDAINCRGGEALGEVIACHPQVLRVLCGHHHRPIQTLWAGTIASVAPSTAHQVVLRLAPDAPSHFNLEPPAYHLHVALPGQGMVTHHAYVGAFAGPYEFKLEDDYPGVTRAAAE
jgi:3',5'-cyclic AMP phosphodiesterase CpdA